MRLPNVLWFFVVLIVIVLLAVIIPPRGTVGPPAMRVVCLANLKGLSMAMNHYADGYDSILPTENWCDLLIEEASIHPKSLVCPVSDAIEGECTYAMNKNVAGKNIDDLPDDVVLFFETEVGLENGSRNTPIQTRRHYEILKEYYNAYCDDAKVYADRFNQLGGVEDLVLRHDSDGQLGCNIAFADGRAEFVTEDRIADLKWTVE